jgi:SAM-dependent methyltransferase
MSNALDEKMRADWNRRAATEASAMYYVIHTFDGSRELFYASGEKHWLDMLNALAKVGVTEVKGVAVELGCGMGRMTGWMAPHFRKLYALDISDEMLAKAPKLPNVAYMSTIAMPFIMPPVDFVLSFLVLQHMPKASAWAYVESAQSILKPGGIFCSQLHMTAVPVDRSDDDTLLVRGYTPLEIKDWLDQHPGWTPLMVLGEAGISEPFRWLILRKK